MDVLFISAAVLLIVGLKLMGRAATARKGNVLSGIGMLLAVATTLWAFPPKNIWILVSIVTFGSLIGIWTVSYVKMTAMPELVALFNGFGGLASLLVGVVEGLKLMRTSDDSVGTGVVFTQVAIVSAVVIGGITFTGSLVAYGKLSRKLPSGSIVFPFQVYVCFVLLCFLYWSSCGWIVSRNIFGFDPFYAMIAFSLIAGIVFTLHIGGGDMPVVIALLNGLSGVAACAAGLISLNRVLIVAGCLVGTSGLILTLIMCKAMNRSIGKVLLGDFKASETKAQLKSSGEPKTMTAEDAYFPLEAARTVAIVPGYGLAVAQAQHAVKELAQKLTENGAEVFYAIHPVAGRMPGHMNVLLAEADVDYDQLVELEAANARFPETDIAIVVGANDVVNPAAVENKNSPLYGMPILEVFKAKTVLVFKRGQGKGFSGLENELFLKDNVRMIYGDAKKTLMQLAAQFKGE